MKLIVLIAGLLLGYTLGAVLHSMVVRYPETGVFDWIEYVNWVDLENADLGNDYIDVYWIDADTGETGTHKIPTKASNYD